MFKNMKNFFNNRINDLKEKQIMFLIIAAIISLLLIIFPQLDLLEKIFNIFTTIIHETGHAIANLISGNTNISIQVDLLSTGGVTISYGVRNVFTVSAGYLGASLFGGLLLILSARPKIATAIMRVLAAFLIGIAIFFMLGHWVTFFITLLFSSIFIIISMVKDKRITFFFLNFFAVQLIINSFTDIITLIRISMGEESYTGMPTDADNMAQLTFGTNWLWAMFYLLMSIIIFAIAININRKLVSK